MNDSSKRRLPIAAVVACILVSGSASLALETVWSRHLKLVFGSTTLGITTILVAYMLGLGLGGALGGRLAGRLRNGVRAYGWMEVGIGLYALAVPWILDVYPAVNRALVGALDFWPLAFARFGLALAIFLLPTVLMGATLPVLVAALVREDGTVARRVGLLYGVNTFGAMAGVLGATFVLFPWLGLAWTNTVAAVLDVAVGLVAIAVVAPRIADRPASDRAAPDGARDADRAPWTVPLVVYGIVGFTALAYEIAWTRALTLVLGSSVYAFSTMLAAFLGGIAIGSLLAHRWLDRLRRPAAVYAMGLASLGVASLGVAFAFRWLPTWFRETFVDLGVSGSTQVWLGFATAFAVMLAPTIVLGALFPLCVRVVASDGRSHARATGQVYAWNTVGSAAGAFLAGFVLIPHLGLRMTMATAIALDFAAAAVVLAVGPRASTGRRVVAGVLAAATIAVVVRPPAWDRDAFAGGAYYRATLAHDYGLPPLAMRDDLDEALLYYREGINATVSVHRHAGGIDFGGITMRINGKADASLSDLSTQVLSGHLPFLFGPPAKTALVIGYASGITTGAAVQYGLERVDVCEIEEAVVEASHFFDDDNHRPLARDDVRLIVEDGRNWLSCAREPYDVIISEPSNPWISGCSNLFTAEFFQLAKRALTPNGRLLQWIQLYDMHPDGLRSIVKSLRMSFAHVYGFMYSAANNDLMLIATDVPLTRATLPQWDALPIGACNDLARLNLYSTADLWSLLTLVTADFDRITGDAVANTDDNLLVELRAPYWLNGSDERVEAVASLLLGGATGIVPILEAEPQTGFDETVGELACAYWVGRRNTPLAQGIVRLLERRGDTTSVALFGAVHDFMLSGYTVASDVFSRLELAVQQRPNAFFTRFNRGQIRVEVAQFQPALDDLEHAVSLRPHHLIARRARAQALVGVRRVTEAQQIFDGLLSTPLVETQHDLWMASAYLDMGFGRFDRALEKLETYGRLFPWKGATWRTLAGWYGGLERTAEAEEAKRLATLADRNRIRELIRYARAREAVGDRDGAIAALRDALTIDADHARARDELRRLGVDPDQKPEPKPATEGASGKGG